MAKRTKTKPLNFYFFIGLTVFMCWAATLQADTLQVHKELPMNARLMSADMLGNIYLVRNDNELLRLNNQGDSTGFYKGVYNGTIFKIDATNPLYILLYYNSLSKVVVLDRMLSPKWEINFAGIQLFNVSAVAMSIDGNVWVYDRFNAQLKKVDKKLEVKIEGIDLRTILNFVPTAEVVIEQDRNVYLLDTANGVIHFDQFGNYMSTFPFKNVTHLQASNQQLFLLRQQQFLVYDRQSFRERNYDLPIFPGETLINIQMTPQFLVALYTNRLLWFTY